jgi:hypothetical protein
MPNTDQPHSWRLELCVANIARFTVSKTKDGLPALVKAIGDLAKKQVLVGVPADKSFRDGEINNAQLAFIHDKGSPAQNIPARPFLEPGIEQGLPAIKVQLKKAAEAAFDGNTRDVDKGLNAAGLVAADAVKRKIVDGPFTPLAAATLAARRRKGFVGTSPLTVTGQLRNAVSYIIRQKS